MKSLRTGSARELGASALTIAIAMVVIVGMAAVAIDAGIGFSERRIDQNSVDSAVMAGAVELALGGSVQEVVDQVKTFVDTNVRPVSDAEWIACDDPDHLELTIKDDFSTVSPATECISFFEFENIRVRLPDQEVDTTFARIIGFDTLTTHAEAEALTVQFPSAGNSPPFVAPSDSAGGDRICLRTNSSGPAMPPLMVGNGDGGGPSNQPSLGSSPDPCDETEFDPSSEFFGALGPLVYFNNQTGEVACKQSLTEYAIARGIDHTLDDFEPDYLVGTSSPVGPDVVEDDCNPEAVAGVNTMQLEDGLRADELRCGMLTSQGGGCRDDVSPGSAGGASVPARLHLGPNVQGTYRFLGERMDNAPLWQFMASPSGSWPSACADLHANRATPSWDYYDKKDELVDCLTDWEDADGQLFTDDIIRTPRFGWLPLLAEGNLVTDPDVCPSSAASRCVHFNDFVPVYIQTLYTLITGGGGAGACDDPERTEASSPSLRWGRHEAGEEIDCGANNGNLDRLSALVLDCSMLSTDVCDSRPGASPAGDITPRLELTK